LRAHVTSTVIILIIFFQTASSLRASVETSETALSSGGTYLHEKVLSFS